VFFELTDVPIRFEKAFRQSICGFPAIFGLRGASIGVREKRAFEPKRLYFGQKCSKKPKFWRFLQAIKLRLPSP
jgi:hypothetical protein